MKKRLLAGLFVCVLVVSSLVTVASAKTITATTKNPPIIIYIDPPND